MKSTRVGLLLLLLALVHSHVFAGATAQAIRRIYFVPVARHFQDQVGDQPGNVFITFADGRHKALTANGNCAGGSYHMPKIAPDHRTVAWLEGTYITPHDFAAETLVIYRDGHVLHKIHGEKAFIETWFFWNGSQQIVCKSRMGHGPAVVELHDAISGRLVARVDAYRINKTSPEWARSQAE